MIFNCVRMMSMILIMFYRLRTIGPYTNIIAYLLLYYTSTKNHHFIWTIAFSILLYTSVDCVSNVHNGIWKPVTQVSLRCRSFFTICGEIYKDNFSKHVEKRKKCKMECGFYWHFYLMTKREIIFNKMKKYSIHIIITYVIEICLW